MKIGYCNSTNRKPCKVCGKLTGDFKTFNQSDMKIEIPMCEEHYKDEEQSLSIIELNSEEFLRRVNKLFKK